MRERKDAYREAGVNIDAGNLFAEMIKERIEEAWPGLKSIGGFAGKAQVPFDCDNYFPSTDGTGTKAILAAMIEHFDGIGQDAVAMGVIDTYVAGARPDGVLDNLDIAVLDPDKHIKIIDSVIRACKMAGCVLLGGETAELPDMFKHDWMFNLNVMSIGFDDQNLEFADMESGQSVYCWPSYGPASNGFSLLRKVFGLKERPSRARKKLERVWSDLGGPLYESLLRPTPIWIKEIEALREEGVEFAGHAHITGGGLIDNPARILSDRFKMVIDRSSWSRPPIFPLVQDLGKISVADMDRTFNNGIMIISVPIEDDETIGFYSEHATLIGVIEDRDHDEPPVILTGKYNDQ